MSPGLLTPPFGGGAPHPFANNATKQRRTIAKNGIAEARFMSIPADEIGNNNARPKEPGRRRERVHREGPSSFFLKSGLFL
jgi:hypothetical protein